MENKSIIGLHRSHGKWVLSKFPFPKVVYNRCYETNQELIGRLGAVIGKDKCFNHINQFDKHEIYTNLSRWLAEYLPDTVPFSTETAVHLLETHEVLYLKPSCGNKGQGVYRVEKKSAEEIQISLHYFAPTIIVRDTKQLEERMQELVGSTPYIIQRGVPIRQVKITFSISERLCKKTIKGYGP